MSFTQMLLDGLKYNLNDGFELRILESVLPGDTDFRTLIIRAKKEKFDAFALFILPAQIDAFLKQAKELNFHPKYLGTTFLESRSLLASVWPTLKDTVYVNLAVPEDFRKQYVERFKLNDQVPYAWNSFHFALYAGELFGNQSINIKPEEIIARLKESKPKLGPMRYVDDKVDPYFQFPMSLQIVDQSGSHSIKKILP